MQMTQVEKYIYSFPEEVRNILLQIRQIVKEEAPDAVEGFAYQMPSYKTNGRSEERRVGKECR